MSYNKYTGLYENDLRNTQQQQTPTGQLPMLGQLQPQPGTNYGQQLGQFNAQQPLNMNFAADNNPNNSMSLAASQLQNQKLQNVPTSQYLASRQGQNRTQSYNSMGYTPLSDPSTKGQFSEWEWGGEGGKAATAVSAFSALGGMYLGNEARKLAASDLDFKRGSFEKQYQSQRSLVNDQLFDRQQRRERENGLSTEQATVAADKYVKNRGVQ